MRVKTYIIPQPPIPWSRAGVSGKVFFDKQKQEKLIYSIYLQQQHNDEAIFIQPCTIEMTFYMAIPELVQKRIKKMKQDKIIYHTVKPDIDNLAKFVLDSISHGVLLSDDKIVYSISAKKLYDEKPRTEFTITEI
jgi:Holliday junction resolvase RusA-like endonuclease